MPYEFDRFVNRRSIANRNKWNWYPEDVLPMWVADMDFLSPPPILEALRHALDHGILGYELPPTSLLELVAERLKRLYDWHVAPEMVVPVPGVNFAYRLAAGITCQPGEGVLVQPPVFYQFVDFPKASSLVRQDAPLRLVEQGPIVAYQFDAGAFAQAMHAGGTKTSMFLLCNPHNPTGQIFTVEALQYMADVCEKNEVVICSDDVHNELLLGQARYTPLAALSPRIAERTITLFGPGKAFNISGLGCAFAVIPEATLRQKFSDALHRYAPDVNSLGLVAARAAYSGACDEWLTALRDYLTANRDYLIDFVVRELPGMRTTRPDATHLVWLDCNALVRTGQVSASPQEFFLKQAKVALSDGATFGPGGAGFVRLNFACPRSVLEEGLRRMQQALAP